MDNESVSYTNDKPRKKKKGCLIILAIAIIIILGIITFFAVLVIKAIKNNNQVSTQTVNVASADDPYQGSAEAKVVIVEFSDFQCPYCLQQFTIAREIINIYGDRIKFIYRDFPLLNDHPEAEKAAEAGECAHEQGKFWEMHDKMFINQPDLSVKALKSYAQQIGLDTNKFNSCLDNDKYRTEVLTDYNEGVDAGVIGTPVFFINNRKYEGIIPLETFKKIIDTELSRFQ